MNEHTICFDVVGSIIQRINILEPDLTVDDIVTGLNQGTMATTVQHGEPEFQLILRFNDDNTETVVAEILNQHAADEMEYSRFQIDE